MFQRWLTSTAQLHDNFQLPLIEGREYLECQLPSLRQKGLKLLWRALHWLSDQKANSDTHFDQTYLTSFHRYFPLLISQMTTALFQFQTGLKSDPELLPVTSLTADEVVQYINWIEGAAWLLQQSSHEAAENVFTTELLASLSHVFLQFCSTDYVGSSTAATSNGTFENRCLIANTAMECIQTMLCIFPTVMNDIWDTLTMHAVLAKTLRYPDLPDPLINTCIETFFVYIELNTIVEDEQERMIATRRISDLEQVVGRTFIEQLRDKFKTVNTARQHKNAHAARRSLMIA